MPDQLVLYGGTPYRPRDPSMAHLRHVRLPMNVPLGTSRRRIPGRGLSSYVLGFG